VSLRRGLPISVQRILPSIPHWEPQVLVGKSHAHGTFVFEVQGPVPGLATQFHIHGHKGLVPTIHHFTRFTAFTVEGILLITSILIGC
jgi:hypothetical protein